MHVRRQFLLTLLLLLVSLPLMLVSTGTHAGCSPYIGQATLNEYYHDNQSPVNANNYFIETKILDSGLNPSIYNNWSILICSRYGPDSDSSLSRCITGDYSLSKLNILLGGFSDTNYVSGLTLASASGSQSWKVLDQGDFPAGYVDNNANGKNKTDHGMEVFLLDQNHLIIDYTSVADYSVHANDLGATSCNYLYDNAYPGANTFTTQRLPDGTGCWPQDPTITSDTTANGTTISCLGAAPPSGSSGTPTEETPNTDNPTTGSFPYLAINDVDVTPGGTATFTVSIAGIMTVTGSGGSYTYTYDSSVHTFGSDVVFDYRTLDGTATTAGGDYTAVTLTSATITTGNSSTTVTVSTNSTASVAEYFNAIISQSASDTSGALIIDNNGIATFVAPSVHHFAISHDGTAVNCQAEPVIISAHSLLHLTNPLYIGTLSLTTSTGHGDWSILSGNGVLDNGVADDGSATYSFSLLDLGSVTLGLSNTHAEVVNINVTDGLTSEDSSEDNDLTFAQSGFVFLADGQQDAIGSQIGGKGSDIAPGAQTIALRAITTDPATGVCSDLFPAGADVTLAMAAECRNPSSCAGQQVSISNNGNTVAVSTNNDDGGASSTSSYTNLPLRFGVNSSAVLTFFYPDVGQMQLHARYDQDGNLATTNDTLIGASNRFAVRPFGYQVTARDAGGIANPGATGPADAIFVKAGEAFTVDVTAVLWQSGDDSADINGDGNPDHDGFPDGLDDNDPTNDANLADNTAAPNYGQETPIEIVSLTPTNLLPSGGVTGTLTGGSITMFASGSGSATAVSYSEAGIIDLKARPADTTYLLSPSDATWQSATSYAAGDIVQPTSANGHVYVAITGSSGSGTSGASEPSWPSDDSTVGDGTILWRDLGVVGRTGYVGRFTPASFAVITSDGAYANIHNGGGTAFTYVGEPFDYLVDPIIDAYPLNINQTTWATSTGYALGDFVLSSDGNGRVYQVTSGGSSGSTEPTWPTSTGSTVTVNGVTYQDVGPITDYVTLNYSANSGEFSKLTSSHLSTVLAAADTTSGLATSGSEGTLSGPAINADGSLRFTLGGADISLLHNTTPLAPFTSNIPITLNTFTDTDSIAFTSGTTITPVGNLQRYGRAVLVDTYGPSDLPLDMLYYTEYFDGANFLPNSDDITTSLSAASDLSCSSSSFSCSVDGSIADVQISGTGITPGNSFTLTPSTAVSGSMAVQLNTPAWLTFDWNGDATLDPASATASFGLYRGDDRFFYWGEVQ